MRALREGLVQILSSVIRLSLLQVLLYPLSGFLSDGLTLGPIVSHLWLGLSWLLNDGLRGLHPLVNTVSARFHIDFETVESCGERPSH